MAGRPRGRQHSAEPTDRGQSNLIGLVLILGITAIGMAVILMFGVAALTDSQAASEVSRAEHSMTELDSKISLTALGSSARQQPSIPLDGGESQLHLDEDAGWMNVTVRNASNGSVRTTLMNETLGSLIYKNAHQDVSIAYQGGGVWRQSNNGVVMVSPPEFHYRTDSGNPTLTLPLIVLKGQGSVGNDVVVQKSGKTEPKYPKPGDTSRTNPLTEGQVNITIKSQYYRAWGAFFADRTDGRVSYDDSANRAMITLVVPAAETDQTVDSAISATNPGGTLSIAGTGGYIDSYNSTNGSYASQTPGSSGNITYGGDIDVSGNADLKGNLKSGSEVILSSGGMTMDGQIFYTNGYSDPHGHADGYQQIDGVGQVRAIDDQVEANVSDIESSNDNVGVNNGTIESGDCDPCTLTDGRYYLEQIDLSQDEELKLDTSSGDITVAVENYILLDGSGQETVLNVTGPGQVRIYVRGTSGTNNACYFTRCHLAIGKNSEVEVQGDNSSNLRIYGKQDFKTTVRGSGSNLANFTGVVYAPAGSGGLGEAYFQHGHVFGSVISGSAIVDNKAHLHFDHALTNEQIAPPTGPGADIARITYLHISVNNVSVSSG